MKRSDQSIVPAICLTAIIFLAVLSSVSCGGAAATGNLHRRPTLLRYCFTSTNEDAGAAGRRLDIIKSYLERTLRVRVEVTQATGYGTVIEAFRANKIDLASISPFSYVLASRTMPIEAIAMRGNKDGTPADYAGALAVPGSSPIHTVEDLVKHSRELTISFVDPASTSGFLVQNSFLQSLGMDPQRDFKKVLFSMNHLASMMTLKAGKVDVAATMLRLIRRYEETGKLAAGDVRIIWVSPPIPNQPVAVRKDLAPEFKQEIQRAFLTMDNQTYEGMVPKALSGVSSGEVFVASNDRMFDGLRKMAHDVKNISLLDQ